MQKKVFLHLWPSAFWGSPSLFSSLGCPKAPLPNSLDRSPESFYWRFSCQVALLPGLMSSQCNFRKKKKKNEHLFLVFRVSSHPWKPPQVLILYFLQSLSLLLVGGWVCLLGTQFSVPEVDILFSCRFLYDCQVNTLVLFKQVIRTLGWALGSYSLIRYQWVCPEPTALCFPLHEHLWVLRMHLPNWLRPQGRPEDVQR